MLSVTDSNQFNSLEQRKESFKKTCYEKCRNKCTIKKMAEAGFYFTPNQNLENDPDMVTCYACGIQLSNWNKKQDDPLAEHAKESPDCLYVKKKKNYTNELTIYEFMEVEKYRLLKKSDNMFNERKNYINESVKKMIKMLEEANEMNVN